MQFDANGWLDEAIEIDYLQKSMSRQGYQPTHVVLHGTAGGTRAEDTANYFATSTVESSSHFIIGQDGHIVQGVPCSLAAWGNGILKNPRLPFPSNVNPNYYTISIEHCKPHTDNSDQLTSAQKQASFRLVKVICEHYNIPKRRGDAKSGIVEHADFDSVSRARCPGPYPYTELWAFLGQGTTGVPAGWKDANNVLTAPNGITIIKGFREWVLTHRWDPNNYPLMAEQPLEQVEQGNPELGAGTIQPFRMGILAWTAERGVYVMWVGQEYCALYQQWQKALNGLRDANVEIAKLQQRLEREQQMNEAAKDYQNRLVQIAQIAKVSQI